MITDTQSLKAAKGRFGHEIPIYDDGFGPLFIHRDSMGINGIVRAQTWEDAYNICEDEFFPEAKETIEDFQRMYGFRSKDIKIIRAKDGTIRPAEDSDYPLAPDQFIEWKTEITPDENAWADNVLFNEAYGFRPSGPKVTDTIKHGIYEKDLNGDSLDPLTPELCKELEITLEIEDDE